MCQLRSDNSPGLEKLRYRPKLGTRALIKCDVSWLSKLPQLLIHARKIENVSSGPEPDDKDLPRLAACRILPLHHSHVKRRNGSYAVDRESLIESPLGKAFRGNDALISRADHHQIRLEMGVQQCDAAIESVLKRQLHE